jgi:uncharacterized repeat protein (TIGR03837 family)
MPAHSPQLPRTWDIFCRVIDNFGDIGVCWRLSRALASRGQQVRMWVDDASALAWMAPGGCEGVGVMQWTQDAPRAGTHELGDVVIEAFGCEIPQDWIASEFIALHADSMRANRPFSSKNTPIWINLEYLSAERYVQRSHGLPSPVMSGAAKGMTKWFFYPGFTAKTGGLIREPSIADAPPQDHAARSISLFCYEPPALASLLGQLNDSTHRTELLVTAGRAQRAVRAFFHENHEKNGSLRASGLNSLLSIQELSYLSQDGYDALLQRSELNFVRGEDSLVRAIWAGQAFVWNIYPQSDGAHIPKLHAFLDWLQAPDDLRLFHDIWNGVKPGELPTLSAERLTQWRACAQAARDKLRLQTDLVTQLLDFVEEKASGA